MYRNVIEIVIVNIGSDVNLLYKLPDIILNKIFINYGKTPTLFFMQYDVKI